MPPSLASYRHPPPGDWSKGNPSLKIPHPDGKIGKQSGQHKKLIVLCDGTGQDNNGSTAQNPTNITRIARALTPNTWVWNAEEEAWEEWEQIVHYQAGVGTFEGNAFWGVVFGTGLSEIVRSAYGFLANNYQDGDKIYIFGFSRGAYVARSIAGLVADHGLLTKRGMDNFHAVYETFYNYDSVASDNYSDIRTRKLCKIPARNGGFMTAKEAGLRPVPPHTVEVIGVFDTVAFHNVITNKLNQLLRMNVFDSQDRPEFENNELSIRVSYTFHALSLDETRRPFQTTLFFKPDQRMNQSGDSTILKQVWFSGVHSDIGGGMQDPRLSNIALGWMVSELEHYKLLSFDRNYLLGPGAPEVNARSGESWNTCVGENNEKYANRCKVSWHFWHKLSYGIGCLVWYGFEALSWTVINLLKLFPTNWARSLSGIRTPGEYSRIFKFKHVKTDPNKLDTFVTCETLHESVQDRWMDTKKSKPNGEVVKHWPCKPLKGFQEVDNSWTKDINYKDYHHWSERFKTWWQGEHKDAKPLPEVVLEILKSPSRPIEMLFKNRLRFEGRNKEPWFAASEVPVEECAVPIVEQLPE